MKCRCAAYKGHEVRQRKCDEWKRVNLRAFVVQALMDLGIKENRGRVEDDFWVFRLGEQVERMPLVKNGIKGAM